ncbi:MAG: molybdate ABC transporter substrate-binding protein [Phenylobacterium zucineum]|nr:MAG: molybdate ABC transporter substrate-binding protein [Phenylobacterium zucineum]
MLRRFALALALLPLIILPHPALAGQVRVAVAANLLEPAQAIAAAFRAETGNTLELGVGSTGQLYVQITHGAPYDVFLSADATHPAMAEAAGLAVPGSRLTYGIGRLVLYSKIPGLVDDKGAVLTRGGFAKLAIADPETAPYGRAAVQTLKKLKAYDRIRSSLVQGASMTQTFHFVETGAADLGFVALSQVIKRPGGSRWLVPAADHTPLVQQAVLMKVGAGNPAAKAFLVYLKSRRARAILADYGYQAP